MHSRTSHTFLDSKVSKRLFLPEWMRAIITDYNWSNYLSSSFHPHSLSVHSFLNLHVSVTVAVIARSDKGRLGGDWPIAWSSPRNDLWPWNWWSGSAGWGLNMKGGWRVFPCSSSWRGSTSNKMKTEPPSRWSQALSLTDTLTGPQQPLPPPPLLGLGWAEVI